MTNQELFERAVAGNWIAESFNRPNVADGVGKFYLEGSSKGYTNFGDTIDDGSVVFYAAFDDACNREAGFATFNASDQSLTPIESTATLANDQYIDGDVAPIAFPNGGTITGTFNAVAFNAIWAHIWDKNNPHEVDAGQVEQDNENLLGDNVQDALDNLSGIIAEWDNAIKATIQNYVQELPPPDPQKGDMWTDVGVTGEQYVWEGEYWVSVTGGGLGVDLDDLDSYSSKVTTDVVEDDQLYDIPLERVISRTTGKGEWVAGGDGSGQVFVPEAPDDGLQYGRQSGTWTEIDAGGVWDADGINGPDGGGIGHYYHLSNAPNTNIFETAIGSDEVKMLNMQSVASASFTDLDGNPILTGYSTETYVDEAIAAIPPTDFDGYATETYVDDSIAAIPPTDFDGYATEVYVDEAIDAIELPDGSVLDDYATKTYVDEEIAAIPATDLTGYATETWVGSNYQVKGSYSLTNHNHDDRYYQKTETKKIVVLTEAEYNNLGSKDASTVYFLT
jgi:hypothetical protein